MKQVKDIIAEEEMKKMNYSYKIEFKKLWIDLKNPRLYTCNLSWFTKWNKKY